MARGGAHLEPGLACRAVVGEGLRLNALRRVHQKEGALAGGERAADLVAEVHVACPAPRGEGAGGRP